MAEILKLEVDTGASTIEIVDKDQEKIGEFKFNPADPGIVKRYENVVDFFNDVEFGQNLTDDQKVEEIKKLIDAIADQFDYLLGYKVADSLFGTCSPLAVIANGDFYFENVLEGIGNLVSKTTNQRINKKLAKIKKATAKYSK